MPGKRGTPVLSEAAHARIWPDVRPVSAKPPEFDIIDVPCPSMFVDKD
jgi:hypothetical protein